MIRRFLPVCCRFALLLLLTLPAACAPTSAPLTGSLAGDQRWQGVVRIAGDLVLEPGSDLRIEPGTEVLFLPPAPGADRWTDHPHFPGSELIVKGRIRAEGRADAPITFRYIDPSAPAGSWGGINLVASPEARFRFCAFRQADSALHSQESRVVVEESLIEENLVGIRFHSSDMRIENNTLRDNGSAIRFHFGAPQIRFNDIRDNGKGFFITSFPRDYRIEQNRIVDNRQYSVVLGEQVPETVHMEHNYWGTTDPAVIEEGFFDGRREPYLGRVSYRPVRRTPIEEAGISWNR